MVLLTLILISKQIDINIQMAAHLNKKSHVNV